ncbi:monoamine oxidase [Rhizobium mesoamericanum]|uniref:flavin monoamine oxidase family protein n=1 Tax=Rhizobium mesoamericanum TaxID=1079800 RepID=UPI0027824FD6|nr:FAD-dependent oxidoreductase [Rhizobium mesoamericanum]MDQ0561122.1 monoamine oxidase [Rhizobium mesoamericanum]
MASMTTILSKTVVIVGGGLAGLTAAYHLHRNGLDFTLVEARDRLGGRILTADLQTDVSSDGFDLGPSWFWPDMHPTVQEFARELGLSFFPQYSDGALVFQRSRETAPERYGTMRQEPISMRLSGGTGAIVSALSGRLPQASLRLAATVSRIAQTADGLKVRLAGTVGSADEITASHVILALPPRLLAETIVLDPTPADLIFKIWRDTPTWMAPHAKIFALYDRPFWREAGLSGAARSMVGPLVEIHDATTASGKAALFGFVGVPAPARGQAGRDAIISASITQLGQLFGPQALAPISTLYKDWADDPLTATSLDRMAGDHPQGSPREWVDQTWRSWISLAGSETAIDDPGYLAGAIEAGARAATTLITWRDEDRLSPILEREDRSRS